MPKVGQFRFSLNGQTQMLDVWYKREEGFFLKGLPEEFVVLTDFHNYFGTEKEMKGYVNEKIELYQKLKTTERFSILYKCSATTETIMNKVGPHHFSGHGVGISEKIERLSNDGYGFSIDFKKVKIIDNGDRPVYYEIDIDTGQMDSYSRDLERSDFQEMPYTEERLQFFLGVAEAIKKTVMQISKFFDMDQNDAMLFVDSKQKLLS